MFFTNYTFLIIPITLNSKSDLFFYLVCPEFCLDHGEVDGIGDDMVVVGVIPLGGKLHEDVPQGAALWVLNTMGSERFNCNAS